MTDTQARRSAFRFGLGAETRAVWLLRLKGYRIEARRWRTPRGEADIIARRRDILCFVEVKARSDLSIAREAIRPAQERRIAEAARAWLARHPADMTATIRFDAIYCAPRRWPVHVEGAFERDI